MERNDHPKVNSLIRINNYLTKKGLFNWMEDEMFLKMRYRVKLGTKLNLEKPQTFNEKMQWLKLYDRNPIYTKMVDKYEVKKLVSESIGDQYIIPTYGIWEKFEDICFDELPNQFVLKCTHDSGGVVIIKDKNSFDLKDAKRKINKSLSRNYYWEGREWPYKNVKPRIIAEKYMIDESDTELKDYKMMCFNGKMMCVFVCSERNLQSGLHITIYDREWNKMPFGRNHPASDLDIEKPKKLDRMIYLSEKFSADLPFLRVDLYEINGCIFLES